jgi:hypothetical protein
VVSEYTYYISGCIHPDNGRRVPIWSGNNSYIYIEHDDPNYPSILYLRVTPGPDTPIDAKF